MVKREYGKIPNECTVMRSRYTLILNCTCGCVCNCHTQLYITAIRRQVHESTNQIIVGFINCVDPRMRCLTIICFEMLHCTVDLYSIYSG